MCWDTLVQTINPRMTNTNTGYNSTLSCALRGPLEPPLAVGFEHNLINDRRVGMGGPILQCMNFFNTLSDEKGDRLNQNKI